MRPEPTPKNIMAGLLDARRALAWGEPEEKELARAWLNSRHGQSAHVVYRFRHGELGSVESMVKTIESALEQLTELEQRH